MAKILTASFALLSILATPALARDLQCNKNQTRCITEGTNLTIGDQVGIFNHDGELVAKGRIMAMRGERRAVAINGRTGTIHKGYKLALLENPTSPGEPVTAYKVYHEPSMVAVGATAGYSEVSIGEGSPATEFTAFAQWRKWQGIQLVARGVYTAMEGSITRSNSEIVEQLPISMSGLGLLGGVGYVMRENQPLSFRGEVGLGGMQISAAAGGERRLVDDGETNAHITNGLSLYGRWTLGAMYNMSDWHLHADLAESLVQRAFANTLAFGVSKDLK